jgi:hypothetical protein
MKAWGGNIKIPRTKQRVKTTELVNNLKFNDNYSFKIINPDQYA